MTLTAAQSTSFFTHGTQMGLTASQRNALAAQGLVTCDDFIDFGKEELAQALRNMRTAIPGVAGVPAVLDPADNAIILQEAIPAVPAIPPIIMPAKSAQRLEVASVAWHYYTDTSRRITNVNMHYNNVLKDFHIEWKAIVSMSKDTAPDIPCIHKNNPPLRWADTFMDYCLNTFGVRKAPLAYVIRPEVEVLPESRAPNDTDSPIDPLKDNCSYGNSGSVLDDLITRLSHNHPLFKTDNAKVYSALEEATRSTVYSSTVKPFSRKRDGRAAWKALINSHAGSDKWEILQKENNHWLMMTKWNGRVYSLEKFCNQHRSRFVNLEEAKNHVDFQLPTEHSRVGFLIDNIENPDADLRAAIANIRQDVNGTRYNFEAAIAVLLPVDPYLKHRKKSGQSGKPGANISSAAIGDEPSAGIGKTGVHLRFHKVAEYNKLNAAQKDELYTWRQTQNGKKFTSDEKKKRKFSDNDNITAKQLKSAVKSALAQEKKKQKKLNEDIDSVADIIANASISSPANAAKANTSSTSMINDSHRAAAMKLIGIKDRASSAMKTEKTN